MRLSAKLEYAAVALLALAEQHDSGEVVQLRTITAGHCVPHRFLVQILVQLKTAGLVVSTRGAAGGYQLARAPESITLADVWDAVEPRDESYCQSPSPLAKRFREAWDDATTAFHDRLESATLADLVQAARRGEMYYI